MESMDSADSIDPLSSQPSSTSDREEREGLEQPQIEASTSSLSFSIFNQRNPPPKRKSSTLAMIEDLPINKPPSFRIVQSLSTHDVEIESVNEEMVIPLPKSALELSRSLKSAQTNAARIARGEETVDAPNLNNANLSDDSGETNRMINLEESIEISKLPLLLRHRNPSLDEITDERDRFNADVSSRPDEPHLDHYERVPIEEFGKALLRGMGWKPGAVIGLNGKGLANPIIHQPRPQRLGLGASPILGKDKHKDKRPSSSDDQPSAKIQKVRTDDRLTERVVQNTSVLPSEIWVRRDLIVKIVRPKTSSVYCRKARILEIDRSLQTHHKEGDIKVQILEGSRKGSIRHVLQDQLETVIPNVGKKVMVVGGERSLCGRIGTLISREPLQHRVQVKLETSSDVLHVFHLDDISAFSTDD